MEKENRVVFRKVADEERMCVIGVSDTSYHQEKWSVAGEMIMMGNKVNIKVSAIYCKSRVIRKVYTSLKSAETQGVIENQLQS